MAAATPAGSALCGLLFGLVSGLGDIGVPPMTIEAFVAGGSKKTIGVDGLRTRGAPGSPMAGRGGCAVDDEESGLLLLPAPADPAEDAAEPGLPADLADSGLLVGIGDGPEPGSRGETSAKGAPEMVVRPWVLALSSSSLTLLLRASSCSASSPHSTRVTLGIKTSRTTGLAAAALAGRPPPPLPPPPLFAICADIGLVMITDIALNGLVVSAPLFSTSSVNVTRFGNKKGFRND